MTGTAPNRPEPPLIAEPLTLPGCLKIFPKVHRDERGRLVKTVHHETYSRYGLISSFREQFYSFSRKGVLRGLHVQLPPAEQHKLVACLQGEVLDVILDLRTDSPTYGQHELVPLDGERGAMVYMPPGIAHGFYACDDSLLLYHVTSQHAPAQDAGIRWNSAGIPWPDDRPELSERDRAFPSLAEFTSPFRFHPEGSPL